MVLRDSPLTAPAPEEVPLPNAPLVRVITRISFPPVVSIGKSEFIAPFQEAVRASYPVLRPEQTLGLFIGRVPPTTPPTAQTTWRFSDTKDAWRVSLAADFLALETTAYLSRTDFVDRFRVVVNALAEYINPQVIDRVGLRYIDRVTGDPLKTLSKYVRSEVMGILATAAAKNVRHAMSESMFDIPNTKAQLLARWGQLPPNATVDQAALDAIAEPSWILDLDMFRATSGPFDSKLVVSEVDEYADRIYTFFRWAVTDDFLRLYGGRV